jgi:hypothetical protein
MGSWSFTKKQQSIGLIGLVFKVLLFARSFS